MTEFFPPTQQTAVDPSTEQWFESLQTTPEPPKKSRKVLLVVIAGSIVLVAVAVGVVSALFGSSALSCLDASDYKTLSGTDVSEVSTPPDEFYSNYMSFKSGSTEYDLAADTNQHGKGFLQSVANFYTSNKTKKSILISIHATYFSESSSALAASQSQMVKSELMQAGVPSSAITTSSPVYIEPEGDTATQTEIVVGISSDQTCK